MSQCSAVVGSSETVVNLSKSLVPIRRIVEKSDDFLGSSEDGVSSGAGCRYSTLRRRLLFWYVLIVRYTTLTSYSFYLEPKMEYSQVLQSFHVRKVALA